MKPIALPVTRIRGHDRVIHTHTATGRQVAVKQTLGLRINNSTDPDVVAKAVHVTTRRLSNSNLELA